ncbi:hypothetical protein EJB05_18793, partial [Eragrostis curvula]
TIPSLFGRAAGPRRLAEFPGVATLPPRGPNQGCPRPYTYDARPSAKERRHLRQSAAPTPPFAAACSTGHSSDSRRCRLHTSDRRLRLLGGFIRQLGFGMSGHGDAEGVTASMEELRVELEGSSSMETRIVQHEDGRVVATADDDDIWGDDSDSPGHESTLDREWSHRKNQFHKMGYRDGITEGQKDSAQEGFNVGFRQSVNVGYKWGLVRGVTSALASLPDSLKEKLLPDVHCREKLQDLHNSVRVISADDALQMFHNSIRQNKNPSEEPHGTSEDGASDSNSFTTLSKDLVVLLHECPDVKVSEELR